MDVGQQLDLLVQHVRDQKGHPFTVVHIANATGITQQAILNLLHGRATNPRLDTLQRLSSFYGISLDYFDCKTEAECLNYLTQAGKIGENASLIQAIDAEAQSFSPETSANILAILQWRLRGSK